MWSVVIQVIVLKLMIFCLYSYLRLAALRLSFFFFNDTATTEIYTLSLHDALPISNLYKRFTALGPLMDRLAWCPVISLRSEEHTSELQSPCNLVCRLLLEKKKRSLSNA